MSKDSILWAGDHTSRRQIVHMDSHLYTRFLLQSDMKHHFKTKTLRVSWYYIWANSECNWGTWSTSTPKTQSSTTRDSRCCSIISFCHFSMICFLLCAICCLFQSSCNMICSVWRLLLLFFFGLCMLAVNCYLCFYFPTILKRTITFIQRCRAHETLMDHHPCCVWPLEKVHPLQPAQALYGP